MSSAAARAPPQERTSLQLTGEKETNLVTIMGTVGSSGKYLVTDMPVASQAHTPLFRLKKPPAGASN